MNLFQMVVLIASLANAGSAGFVFVYAFPPTARPNVEAGALLALLATGAIFGAFLGGGLLAVPAVVPLPALIGWAAGRAAAGVGCLEVGGRGRFEYLDVGRLPLTTRVGGAEEGGWNADGWDAGDWQAPLG